MTMIFTGNYLHSQNIIEDNLQNEVQMNPIPTFNGQYYYPEAPIASFIPQPPLFANIPPPLYAQNNPIPGEFVIHSSLNVFAEEFVPKFLVDEKGVTDNCNETSFILSEQGGTDNSIEPIITISEQGGTENWVRKGSAGHPYVYPDEIIENSSIDNQNLRPSIREVPPTEENFEFSSKTLNLEKPNIDFKPKNIIQDFDELNLSNRRENDPRYRNYKSKENYREENENRTKQSRKRDGSKDYEHKNNWDNKNRRGNSKENINKTEISIEKDKPNKEEIRHKNWESKNRRGNSKENSENTETSNERINPWHNKEEIRHKSNWENKNQKEHFKESSDNTNKTEDNPWQKKDSKDNEEFTRKRNWETKNRRRNSKENINKTEDTNEKDNPWQNKEEIRHKNNWENKNRRGHSKESYENVNKTEFSNERDDRWQNQERNSRYRRQNIENQDQNERKNVNKQNYSFEKNNSAGTIQKNKPDNKQNNDHQDEDKHNRDYDQKGPQHFKRNQNKQIRDKTTYLPKQGKKNFDGEEINDDLKEQNLVKDEDYKRKRYSESNKSFNEKENRRSDSWRKKYDQETSHFIENKKQWPQKNKSFKEDLFEDKKKYRDLKTEREDGIKLNNSYERKSGRFSFGNSEDQKIEDLFDRSYELYDEEYKEFLTELSNNVNCEAIKIQEEKQDLFEVPNNYSLAHCVAEDFRMGSGIAVDFKKKFKSVDKLLAQFQKPGGLAILNDKTDQSNRFIYYLVTKRRSSHKPTYKDFWCSIKQLREHIKENNVKHLAIPKLGCGLDKLDWSTVKHIIEFLFKNVDIEILYCRFGNNEDISQKSNKYVGIYNCVERLIEIEEKSIIIYFCTADDVITNEMKELEEKYKFLDEFKKIKKNFGTVINYKTDHHTICGCTIKKTINDKFDFKSFKKCIDEINKISTDELFTGLAMNYVYDENDPLLHHKVITMLINYLKNVNVYVHKETGNVSLDET